MITIGGKDIADIVIDNKNVVKIQDAITLDVMWQKVAPITDYFYIENTYAGQNTISITTGDSGTTTGNHATSLQYSKDKANWTTITLSGTNTIPMSQGEKVYFRNDNGYFNWYNNMSDYFITTITCSEIHSVGGNINTLLDYTDDNVSCSTGCFYQLFVDNSKLTNAENLSLPATNLANLCYTQMFYLCSSLTTAPALPATTLAESCYNGMFWGCTSLTAAPALPATVLSTHCYDNMFRGCTSLTTAPTLPATTLATGCYSSMFFDCTSLTSAPALPATTLESNCYSSMFYGCTSLTTAPVLPATTLVTSCYYQMFQGCTSLTTAPSLPATTLAGSCYQNMFKNCTALTVAPSLPVTTLEVQCYARMLQGCTSLTTAPVLPATTLVSGCYLEMFKGCTSLNDVTTYANDVSATNCIRNWLYNVAATGTFYNNGSASYTYPSASGIPQGWQEVKPSPYEKYFYVENLDDGTGSISGKNTLKIKTYVNSGVLTKTIEYSKDKTSWTTLNLSSATPTTIEMNVGDKIYFRNTSGTWNTINSYTQFYCSYDFSVGGDVTSLLDYRVDNLQTLPNYCFTYLLFAASHLINSHNLILPSITSNSCYDSMFSGCSNLTTTPSLPATTLADSCYYHMFYSCSSLATISSLPATTLAYDCYEGMFSGCRSLTSVDLTAETLAGRSCQLMFEGCTGLRNATLRATTIVSGSCINMFLNCSSLNSITTYTSDVSASNCLQNWVQGVAATGTFYNLGGATYSTGTSGIPSGWTEVHS